METLHTITISNEYEIWVGGNENIIQYEINIEVPQNISEELLNKYISHLDMHNLALLCAYKGDVKYYMYKLMDTVDMLDYDFFWEENLPNINCTYKLY
jgi:hypothetical protein